MHDIIMSLKICRFSSTFYSGLAFRKDAGVGLPECENLGFIKFIFSKQNTRNLTQRNPLQEISVPPLHYQDEEMIAKTVLTWDGDVEVDISACRQAQADQEDQS